MKYIVYYMILIKSQHLAEYGFEDSQSIVKKTSSIPRLCRSKILQSEDWQQWKEAEFLQLNQYADQKMFGDPISPPKNAAILNFVWNYVIKTDGSDRKKAKCTCDGSSRSGMAHALDHKYISCVKQTAARIFYALCAQENLSIFGADAHNAFAEAPPPKQTFYCRVDAQFRNW